MWAHALQRDRVAGELVDQRPVQPVNFTPCAASSPQLITGGTSSSSLAKTNYALEDRKILLPQDPQDRPSAELLDWHGSTVFRG